MAIPKIGLVLESNNHISVHQNQGKTALEVVAIVAGKVDECVEAVNGVEQSAIEATAVVDTMKLEQEQFIIETADIRAQLVNDNQTYIDTLETSKTTFETDMTNSLNSFKDSLNSSKTTFETNINTAVQNIISNSETLIYEDVDAKIEEMVNDGTLEGLIETQILTDMTADITALETASATTNTNVANLDAKVNKNTMTVYNVDGYDGVTFADKMDACIADAIAKSNGGYIFIPPKSTMRVLTRKIVGSSNISIIAPFGAMIDASALSNNDSAFEFMGTYGTPIALSVNALEKTTTISLTSTTGLQANDWILIGSNAVAGSTSQPIGEMCRIQSVDSATQITLYDPLTTTYNISDSATVKKANFKQNISIEGLTIYGNSDPNIAISAFMFDTCLNVSVKRVTVKNVGYTGVNFRDVVAGRIADSHFQDITKAGYAYGMACAWACQDISVVNCTGIRMRHLFATGGGTGRQGIPRRIVVEGCTASQMMDAGFDCHPGAEDITFSNCHVYGSDNDGFTLQASSFIIANCTVRNITRHGYFVEHASVKPLQFEIANCRGTDIGGQGVSIVFYSTYPEYRSGIINGVEIINSASNAFAMGQTLTSRAKNIQLSNCKAVNPLGHAYFFRNMDNVSITGCQAIGVPSNKYQYYFYDVKQGVIASNIGDGGQIGVQIDACQNIAVANNIVSNATTGFSYTATSSKITRMGNIANNCTTAYTTYATNVLNATTDNTGGYNL